jgi:LysM repeat protein
LAKYAAKIFLLIILFLTGHSCFAQPDLNDIELTQEQWEAVRDLYAIEAIKLLAKLDTLNYQIDSIKPVRDLAVNFDCEEELFKIVGANREQVADFRRKFDETEKKMTSRLGTPAELRSYYFDEIKESKIKCLPEFSGRYVTLVNYMNAFTSSVEHMVEYPSDSYNVVKGDCLWKISLEKYKTPYLWPAIWDANKITIMNPDYFPDPQMQSLSDPNLIYPGQVLKIPAMKKEVLEEKTKQLKQLRRFRRRTE